MPLRCKFYLKAQKELQAQQLTPYALHGIFFQLLPAEIADFFHRQPLKPFTLCYLPFFTSPEMKTSIFEISLSLLDENYLPEIIARTFMSIKLPTFHIKGIPLTLLPQIEIKPEHTQSFSSLRKEAPLSKDIIIDFLTPTTFKRGKGDYPLPDPYLIFKNLLKKWNAFTSIKISRDIIEEVKKNVYISGCWIKTKKLDIEGLGKIIGFTGRVVLYIDTDDQEFIKILNALIQLAEFSGIGRKTTMGLGKVEVKQ
jgi:CRISPR-associated endoribonuclease Cas6